MIPSCMSEVVNGDGTSTTHQVNPFEDSSADIDSSAVTMHDIDDQSSSGLPLDTTDTMSTTSSVGSSDSSKPEPEKIRIWREAHEKMLKTKDEEEAVKKEELKHSAKKELEEWYTRYAEQLEKSKKANRWVHIAKIVIVLLVCLTNLMKSLKWWWYNKLTNSCLILPMTSLSSSNLCSSLSSIFPRCPFSLKKLSLLCQMPNAASHLIIPLCVCF